MKNATSIRIDFEGKNYELKPKTITGELIDAVAPIRARMKQYSQGIALIEAAIENEELFELIDPMTGSMRPGVSDEQLRTVAFKDRKLMKLFAMPTAQLTTDAVGRKLMAEIVQVTVDRTNLSQGLCEALDSQHYHKDAVAPTDEEAGTDAVQTSSFWLTFPVDLMMDYVESFCQRARI